MLTGWVKGLKMYLRSEDWPQHSAPAIPLGVQPPQELGLGSPACSQPEAPGQRPVQRPGPGEQRWSLEGEVEETPEAWESEARGDEKLGFARRPLFWSCPSCTCWKKEDTDPLASWEESGHADPPNPHPYLLPAAPHPQPPLPPRCPPPAPPGSTSVPHHPPTPSAPQLLAIVRQPLPLCPPPGLGAASPASGPEIHTPNPSPWPGASLGGKGGDRGIRGKEKGAPVPQGMLAGTCLGEGGKEGAAPGGPRSGSGRQRAAARAQSQRPPAQRPAPRHLLAHLGRGGRGAAWGGVQRRRRLREAMMGSPAGCGGRRRRRREDPDQRRAGARPRLGMEGRARGAPVAQQGRAGGALAAAPRIQELLGSPISPLPSVLRRSPHTCPRLRAKHLGARGLAVAWQPGGGTTAAPPIPTLGVQIFFFLPSKP